VNVYTSVFRLTNVNLLPVHVLPKLHNTVRPGILDSRRTTETAGGVIVPDVQDGTAAGLIAWLEWAGSRGEINPSSASARAVAVRHVLEVENAPPESIDLRQLDVRDLLDRFETLKRLEYTQQSMKAYKSRFRASVESYLAWLDKRPDWKTPTRQSQAAAKERNGNAQRKVTASLRKPAEVPAANPPQEEHQTSQLVAAGPAGLTPMIPYEVPLRSSDDSRGRIRARLVLPDDLDRADADRLCKFINSLAFEPPASSLNGDTPATNKDEL
jgi:hypothetical protein